VRQHLTICLQVAATNPNRTRTHPIFRGKKKTQLIRNGEGRKKEGEEEE
jgi:hypothetical protein